MAEAAPLPKPKSDRSLAVDAIKGIGILQVVLHHTLGQSSRLYSEKGSGEWYVMRTLAWASNFAIPLFLFVSAMLLTGSYLKRPEPVHFVWRRASRTLWPYALWTVIYWITRWRFEPMFFENHGRLVRDFITGKGSYHLYFMVILIQLSVAVPFVAAAVRKDRMGFWPLLAMTLGLQEACFLYQKFVLQSQIPATLLIWYVLPLGLGAWIGANREDWKAVWSRFWPLFLAVAVVFGSIFTWISLDEELGMSTMTKVWHWPPIVVSHVANWSSVLFRAAASLALLGAAVKIGESRWGPFWASFGRYSLPIYLAHPIFLKLLGGRRLEGFFQAVPVPALWTFVILCGVSWSFAWVCQKLRLDFILYGQELPKTASPADGK